MNMRRPERIVLCCLFGAGLFASIASILRLAQLHGLRSKDITYTAASSLNWSVAEVSTAIFCACIPSLRPLASALFPSLRSARYGNSTLGTVDGRASKGQSFTAGMELEHGRGTSTKIWAGDEKSPGSPASDVHWAGGWEILQETQMIPEDESVDLKDILREGGVPKKFLQSCPPPTPKEAKRISSATSTGTVVRKS
jgi:hypothetical protein